MAVATIPNSRPEETPDMTASLTIPRYWIVPSARRRYILLMWVLPTLLLFSGITIPLSRKYGVWINSTAITLFVVNARFAIGPRLILRRDASGSVQTRRQFSLPGWTLHEKVLDLSAYTSVKTTLWCSTPSLELCGPGRKNLEISQCWQTGLTRRHRMRSLRAFLRMGRELAITLEIRNEGLHRRGQPPARSSQTGA